LIVGLSVFGVTALPDIYAIVLLVCGALAFPGMGMLVAHFVKEPDAADAAGNAIAFPMMFLSGTFFPLEMMPDFLRSIASVLPLTYFNNGLRDAMIYGNPTSALNNSLIMLGIAAFFIAAGSLVTKWRE
jgi:ABC-2 type transport system permease protein